MTTLKRIRMVIVGIDKFLYITSVQNAKILFHSLFYFPYSFIAPTHELGYQKGM